MILKNLKGLHTKTATILIRLGKRSVKVKVKIKKMEAVWRWIMWLMSKAKTSDIKQKHLNEVKIIHVRDRCSLLWCLLDVFQYSASRFNLMGMYNKNFSVLFSWQTNNKSKREHARKRAIFLVSCISCQLHL